MTLIGYARVTTAEQDLALQLDALQAAGATRIFEDRGVPGARTERPGLNAALSFLRDGDTLVVWKLDRLGRPMTHLLQAVTDLEDRGAGFRSLTEAIDTTTPTGRLVFHIFGAHGGRSQRPGTDRQSNGTAPSPAAPEAAAASAALVFPLTILRFAAATSSHPARASSARQPAISPAGTPRS